MQGRKKLLSGNAGASNALSLLSKLSYYDLALFAVPLPLLLGLLAGELSSLSSQVGVTTGAILSAMAVGHLLFGDPPTRRGPRGKVGGPSA